MTRNEFLKQLEELLRELPEHDRQDAMAYYEDYFDEAGQENEAAVIQKLGSPAKVAATIKNENNGNEYAEYTENGYFDGNKMENPSTPVVQQVKSQKQKRQISWALVIVLLIFTFPVWGGLLSGLFGILVGIIATIFALIVAAVALVFAGVIGGVTCIVAGIVKLFTNPAVGFLVIGLGAVFLAIGLLLLLIVVWLFGKALPAVLRFVVNQIQKLLYRLRGGKVNE